MFGKVRHTLREVSIALIQLYQATISLWLGPCCRFYPSCSDYAIEAIERHGITQGGWLAFKRLLRCHPFNPGGFDPIEESDRSFSEKEERDR